MIAPHLGTPIEKFHCTCLSKEIGYYSYFFAMNNYLATSACIYGCKALQKTDLLSADAMRALLSILGILMYPRHKSSFSPLQPNKIPTLVRQVNRELWRFFVSRGLVKYMLPPPPLFRS